MDRGRATKGRMARAVSGAEAIEIKATISHAQVGEALRHYRLTPRNDQERYIYFFDTPALDLLDAGIILRARRVVGDEHDSTVKFRPVVPEEVGREWRKYRGFKIEADASEKGLVKSASFSMPVPKGRIKRVAVGELPIQRIFTSDQEAFLEKTAGRQIDFSQLVVLGPLMAHRWRVEDPACPWPITVELWKREDGQQMVEGSIKASTVQAAAAVAGFMAYLAEMGAERDREQQTKTRWALEYYAGKLRRGAGRSAGGARAPRGRRQGQPRPEPAIPASRGAASVPSS